LSNGNRKARRRQAIHLLVGGCAFLVKPWGRPACSVVALLGLLYNAVIAPRFGLDRAYRRDGEGHLGGLVTYPLAVLLLLLLFPATVAAGAWVVLAVADPVAAFVGARFPRPRIPGNPRKSLVGAAAGFVAAFGACFGLLAYMDAPRAALAAACAAAAGVAAESLPLKIDDNLPLAAAAALALLAFVG
jgi:dolichol kinase